MKYNFKYSGQDGPSLRKENLSRPEGYEKLAMWVLENISGRGASARADRGTAAVSEGQGGWCGPSSTGERGRGRGQQEMGTTKGTGR